MVPKTHAERLLPREWAPAAQGWAVGAESPGWGEAHGN